jgi:hypothetical protein
VLFRVRKPALSAIGLNPYLPFERSFALAQVVNPDKSRMRTLLRRERRSNDLMISGDLTGKPQI